MRLTELEPLALRYVDSGRFRTDADWPTADGVMFLCPCQGHNVMVWFEGTPADAPGPSPRWRRSGPAPYDLTITPSINLDVPKAQGCRWHGHVTNGEVK